MKRSLIWACCAAMLATTGLLRTSRSADDCAAALKRVREPIVFESVREGNRELFVVRADGSDPVNLTRTPDSHEMHPQASPDGKYITYSRGPAHKRLGPAPEMVGAPAEGWEICMASVEAPDPWVQIPHDGTGNKEPDWAPVEQKQP